MAIQGIQWFPKCIQMVTPGRASLLLAFRASIAITLQCIAVALKRNITRCAIIALHLHCSALYLHCNLILLSSHIMIHFAI